MTTKTPHEEEPKLCWSRDDVIYMRTALEEAILYSNQEMRTATRPHEKDWHAQTLKRLESLLKTAQDWLMENPYR